MFLWWLLSELRSVRSRSYSKPYTSNTNIDLFMAIFMVCTIEVVLMKLVHLYQDNERIISNLFLQDDD